MASRFDSLGVKLSGSEGPPSDKPTSWRQWFHFAGMISFISAVCVLCFTLVAWFDGWLFSLCLT